jgi:hypothetical protein
MSNENGKKEVAILEKPGSMQVEKMMAVGADEAVGTGNLPPQLNVDPLMQRGLNVYHVSQILRYSAVDKQGNRKGAGIDYPFFVLTIPERVDIARLCSPVFGVITGRQQRISSMGWKITRDSKISDRLAAEMKDAYSICKEHAELARGGNYQSAGIVLKCLALLRKRLPDLTPDLSNFQRSLLRWSRRIKADAEDRCSEIEEWMAHPNEEDTLPNLTKKMVFDLHVHGGVAMYKKELNGVLENIYSLPGGSVNPIRGVTVGEAVAFCQIVDGMQPQLYYGDELSYLWYAPRTDNSYGQLPLEALVNKVAEILLFDQRAAEMADGTKPPEKLLAFGEQAPFGALGEGMDMTVPLDTPEQKRIETLVNEARKEGIRIISGKGTPIAVDISRADTFGYQSERSKLVREEVGLVFGASPQEMNLSGSENTSGRSTSETQERYDKYKGIFPILQTLEEFWNHDVIPFRYGTGYSMAYESDVSEAEQVKLRAEKLQSGLYSTNEIRIKDMGEDPFDGPEFDKPMAAQPSALGSDGNPMAMRSVE